MHTGKLGDAASARPRAGRDYLALDGLSTAFHTAGVAAIKNQADISVSVILPSAPVHDPSGQPQERYAPELRPWLASVWQAELLASLGSTYHEQPVRLRR